MSTLKQLIDETTNIKDELVTCYNNLKDNLITKGIECGDTDKMQSLIDKVIEINSIEGWNVQDIGWSEEYLFKPITYIESLNKFYTFSGEPRENQSSLGRVHKLIEFDPISRTYTEKATINATKDIWGYMNLASYKDEVYIYDGWLHYYTGRWSSETETLLHKFNPLTGELTKLSNSPGFARMSANCVDDTGIYCCAGIQGTSTYFNRGGTRFGKYFPGSDTWTTLPNLLSGSPFAIGSNNSEVCVCGGISKPTSSYQFNISSSSWTTLPNLSVGSIYNNSLIIKNKFYNFGGLTKPHSNLPDTEVSYYSPNLFCEYRDVNEERFAPLKPLPKPKYYAYVYKKGDMINLLGGNDTINYSIRSIK